jgi:hypothetical protein
MRETQIMETLHHPHIVSMHAHFIDSEVKSEIKKGVEIDEQNLKVNLPSEETEEIDSKILNFLMRRYKVEEKNLGDEEEPITFKIITFNLKGEFYSVSNFQNKITQVQQIFDMLIDGNVIEPIELYGKSLDPYRQKVIRTIKRFLNQVM